MAERIHVPAVRCSTGRIVTVLADDDEGVWTLDHEGASYWIRGAAALRAFGAELEQDRLAALAVGREWPDADDIAEVYEALALIADDIEAARRAGLGA